MANKQLITKVLQKVSNSSISTYEIGGQASNIVYKINNNSTTTVQNYLRDLKTSLDTKASSTDVGSSFSNVNTRINNLTTAVNSSFSGVNTNINNLTTAVNDIYNTRLPSITNHFTDVQDDLLQIHQTLQDHTDDITQINNNVSAITSTVNTHDKYLKQLVGNDPLSLSTSSPWGQNIICAEVDNSVNTSKINNNDDLKTIAGKINFLRSYPVVVLHYRYSGGTVGANQIYSYTLSKKDHLVGIYDYYEGIETDVSENEEKKQQIYNDYTLIWPITLQLSSGNVPAIGQSSVGNVRKLVPQRCFLSNNGEGITFGAANFTNNSTSVSCNIRVLAVKNSMINTGSISDPYQG